MRIMGIFELAYYMGYKVDVALKLINSKRLPAGKVISVGNITVGGTGKTPATIALAEQALRRKMRPCILTRGYKGRMQAPVLVKEGLFSEDVGDEPLLMSMRFGDKVPVIVGKKRYESGMFALDTVKPPPDLFIMDDGFQHRALKRDVDILLINARDPFDNWKLLPMGRLREPLSQIKRADVIVLSKSEGIDTTGLEETVRSKNHDAPIFKATHVASCIKSQSGGMLSLGALDGNAVYAFCGIGDPGSFRDLLESRGANIVGFREFRDHHTYTGAELGQVVSDAKKSGAAWIITTEKDIMRMRGMSIPEVLYWIVMEFRVDALFYDTVLGEYAISA